MSKYKFARLRIHNVEKQKNEENMHHLKNISKPLHGVTPPSTTYRNILWYLAVFMRGEGRDNIIKKAEHTLYKYVNITFVAIISSWVGRLYRLEDIMVFHNDFIAFMNTSLVHRIPNIGRGSRIIPLNDPGTPVVQNSPSLITRVLDSK